MRLRRLGVRSLAARPVVALLIALGPGPNPAEARSGKEMRCEPSAIVVSGAHVADRVDACAAVRDALEFLAPLDMPSAGRVTVELVAALPPNGEQHAVGRYDARRQVIALLDYGAAAAAASQGPPSLGIPMNRALWRSYVAHEYIAAVVQLGTLPDAERKAVLGHYADAQAFGARSEISMLYYLMNPGMFAVKAYLHFRNPRNGPQFVTRLLEGGG